jgi:hypothetical protein
MIDSAISKICNGNTKNSHITPHHKGNGKQKNAFLQEKNLEKLIIFVVKLNTRVSIHLADCGIMLNTVS